MSNRKSEIALIYAKFVKATGALPSRADMKKRGVSRDSIREQFGDMDSLFEGSKKEFPKYFENYVDPDEYNLAAHRDLQARVSNKRAFVIMSAVAGAPAHEKFVGALKEWADIHDAMLLLIPANYALKEMDLELRQDPDVNIVFEPLKLNSNLVVDPVKIDPKQIDPVQSLDVLGYTEGTVIVGSPKQRRVPVANSNEKLARIIHSTGAITRPRYIPADGVKKRRDRLAEAHHKMGAIVVEVVDDKLFHMRNVQMCRDGSFNDLFYNYSSSGMKFVGCEAIVQGDTHVGETDPEVQKAVEEMCEMGKPKYLIQHDFFSGVSINHHEIKNKVARAILARKKKISLEGELKLVADHLEGLRAKKLAKHIVIVKSNHDEFLDRYLADGNFDDLNREISTELQLLAMKEMDPLQAGLEKFYGVKPGPDLMWLKRDKDFRVAGVESGCHGDLGAHGRKNPGAKGMYKSYGKCNYGHCHHGEIWLEAMSAGTSSYKKLGYNRGSSGWDNSQILQYSDGTRQLVNVIYGSWRKRIGRK